MCLIPRVSRKLRRSLFRDELFAFAKSQGVGIGDIYMIDGSHADARANAFVAGAGKERVIGLYSVVLSSRFSGE